MRLYVELLELHVFSECHFHYVELSTWEKYTCEISFNIAASCVSRISYKTRNNYITHEPYLCICLSIFSYSILIISLHCIFFLFNCIVLYCQVISLYNNSNIFNLNIIDNNLFFFLFCKVFSVSVLSRIRGLMKLYKWVLSEPSQDNGKIPALFIRFCNLHVRNVSINEVKKIMSRLSLGNGELAFSFKNLWGWGGRRKMWRLACFNLGRRWTVLTGSTGWSVSQQFQWYYADRYTHFQPQLNSVVKFRKYV